MWGTSGLCLSTSAISWVTLGSVDMSESLHLSAVGSDGIWNNGGEITFLLADSTAGNGHFNIHSYSTSVEVKYYN